MAPTYRKLRFSLENNPRLTYVPALDGLRALAVLSVMLFHFGTKGVVPGGSLGVDVFFVLSGFLITTLLLQEWASSGAISISHFYVRRALRLFPAVFVFLAVYTAIVIGLRELDFTGHPSIGTVLGNLGLALAYGYNWIGASGGYRVPGMGHLWSLAIEEQYYLVWPGLLLLMLRAKLSPSIILSLSLAIFAFSSSLPFWRPNQPFDRLFFGTDFRLQALMAGSALGQLYVAGILRPSITQNFAFKAATLFGALVLLLLLLTLRNRAPFLFAGGYTFVALVSCLLVASSALNPSAWLSRLLSNRVLTYAGKRSYALYLWHYPFSFWLDAMPLVPQLLLAFALSFGAAELSFRLVESPALRFKKRLSGPRVDRKTSVSPDLAAPQRGRAA